MVRAILIAALLLAAPPAAAYREDMLCLDLLEFLETRPPEADRETWMALAGFYRGMAAGVELLHPDAKGDHGLCPRWWCRRRPRAEPLA